MSNFVKLSKEEVGEIKKSVLYIAAIREELQVVSNKIMAILQKSQAPTLLDDENHTPSKDISEFRKNNIVAANPVLTLNDEDFDRAPKVKIATVTEARENTDKFVDKTVETPVSSDSQEAPSDMPAENDIPEDITEEAAAILHGRLG